MAKVQSKATASKKKVKETGTEKVCVQNNEHTEQILTPHETGGDKTDSELLNPNLDITSPSSASARVASESEKVKKDSNKVKDDSEPVYIIYKRPVRLHL